MKEIKFSNNWNKKLDCNAFTSIRLTDKYNINDSVKVIFKGFSDFYVQVVGKKSFYMENINDYIAYLDTGYNAKECQNILKKMYSKKNINWKDQKIYFYLFLKIKSLK